MKISDLKTILDGNLSHLNKVNVNDQARFEDEIVVYPKNIKKILNEYLQGKINESQLSDWAKFLDIRSEYCCPENPVSIDDEDYYENMWAIIQWLSTPEIDGDITVALVKDYLKILDEY